MTAEDPRLVGERTDKMRARILEADPRNYVDDEGMICLWTDPEELCSMCETHRRMVAGTPSFATSFPGGIPRCTFHQQRAWCRDDVVALRQELANTPRLVDA